MRTGILTPYLNFKLKFSDTNYKINLQEISKKIKVWETIKNNYGCLKLNAIEVVDIRTNIFEEKMTKNKLNSRTE